MRMKRKSVPERNLGVETHPAKFTESNCCSRHHNRCGHVRRAEGLIPVQPGIASQGRGFRENISEASFPIRSTI